jgi:hypothetical protein
VTVFIDYAGRPPAGSGTNWLLVGSDSRADLTPQEQSELSTGGDLGNGRTDTILLVHIPGIRSAEPTTMVSIPRDSYVNIPGWGMDKINVAFAEGGAALLAQTVEEATGLHLDHYAEIGFGGFGGVGGPPPGASTYASPGRSSIHWPVSTCQPVARLSAVPMPWATSAAEQPRAPTWTGWSTSGSSWPLCCAGPAVRRSGSTRGDGTQYRMPPSRR